MFTQTQIAIYVIVTGCLVLTRGSEATGDQPNVDAIVKQIAGLHERIESLEKQVAEFTTTSPPQHSSSKAPLTMPLAEAIDKFNLYAKQHHVGKHQPPLTEAEVVAAIRRYGREGSARTDPDSFHRIAETRTVPASTTIDNVDGFVPGDGFRYECWCVRLRVGGTGTLIEVRDRLISSHPISLEEQELYEAVKRTGVGALIPYRP